MAVWYIGTMGFSYAIWRGVFYPHEMEPSRFLAYYSRIFNSVEIDSTFYGVPSKSTVLGWKSTVPPDFTFSLKVPNAITHQAGLVGANPLFQEFINAARFLEEKLGAVLLQFPPSFRRDKLPVLEEFLSRLPGDLHFAVEVRHPSWYTDSLAPSPESIFRKYNVCWAATEYPGLPESICHTSTFLYIRWIGKHGSFQTHDRERLDRSDKMRCWMNEINDYLPRVEAVYGFFNNDYAGFAAGSADRFKRLLDLPCVDFTQPVQGQLF